MNEMYGSTAPDLFNYAFDHPELYPMMHNDHFIDVWKRARFCTDKASAFGFISHNNVWGADSTAHIKCSTCSSGIGYVIEKAGIMMLGPLPPPFDALVRINPDVVREIYHNFVEVAADILIKRVDADIGKKLAASATFRSPGFPLLLVRAYADDLVAGGMSYPDAIKFIISAESEFRKSMVLYGYALMQDETTAVQLLSGELVKVAAAFLAANGIDLADYGLSESDLILLAQGGISAAIKVCESDFINEINGTIEFVGTQLNEHRIRY